MLDTVLCWDLIGASVLCFIFPRLYWSDLPAFIQGTTPFEVKRGISQIKGCMVGTSPSQVDFLNGKVTNILL